MHARTWGERVYRRDDAARLSGIHLDNLDALVHRAEHYDTLFSARDGGARVFSPRDLAVLAVGREVKRGGRSWLDALAIAFDHLEAPPALDALLILTPTPVRDSGGPHVASEVPATIERSTLIVPIGAIVADILSRIGSA
ncbi:MAG: hypothetical protein J0J10_15690 [Bosea sp.]|uniref:hypothetical protein n=1 Tax=Bosea sp. (in: a-proteobacteria) TaxID=1871050 RepID=UPI001AC381A4|nr:hypothetical protein [Bosea sp. (in: a-proteobacteria)]MBN9470206.1 hypothetical protein [Bosea sp. (in: a-proteobacteria)]